MDVVKGNSKVFWRPKLVAKGDAAGVDEWRGIDFTITEVEMKWLEKCYVAEVHSPTMVDSVQDRILEEGVTSVRVVPIGGSQVLLKPVDGEDLEDLIRDTGGFLENWFSRIVKWTPMEVPREHYTWIRCQGIPLHAWTAEFFESIVSSLGRFITLDDNRFNMKRFDMPRIQILTTSPEAVHKVERVRINGIIYVIRVVEELFPVYYEACPVRRKIVSADSMSTSEVSYDFFDHVFSDGSFPPEEDFQIQKDVEGEDIQGIGYLQDVQNNLQAYEGVMQADTPLLNIDNVREGISGVNVKGDGESQPIMQGLESHVSTQPVEQRGDSHLANIGPVSGRVELSPNKVLRASEQALVMQPGASSSASGEQSICASNGGYAPGSKDLAIVPIPLNVRPAIGDESEEKSDANQRWFWPHEEEGWSTCKKEEEGGSGEGRSTEDEAISSSIRYFSMWRLHFRFQHSLEKLDDPE